MLDSRAPLRSRYGFMPPMVGSEAKTAGFAAIAAVSALAYTPSPTRFNARRHYRFASGRPTSPAPRSTQGRPQLFIFSVLGYRVPAQTYRPPRQLRL